MSRQLPAPVSNEREGRTMAVPGQTAPPSSPLVRLAIALTPDLLRAAERIVLKRSQQPAQRQTAHGMRGHSVQMSEVEIDTSIPFVRRVTVRNATSWSAAPIETGPARSGRLRKGGLIGMTGAVAVVAAVMVRRIIPGNRIIDVQGRQRD